jgi:hypothetical protein
MSVSSTGGAFTAICHGSDGHIAVEPLLHNHCECPGTGEAVDQDKVAGSSIESAADHGHCRDSIAASNFIFSIRKNVKTSIHNVFSANIFLKSDSTHSKSFFGYLSAQNHDLSSFFTPLRTVILLA